MLVETSTFVVRIIHYFVNLIARRLEKSDSLFTGHNMCCNWSWLAVFLFSCRAPWMGEQTGKLENVCGLFSNESGVYFALS